MNNNEILALADSVQKRIQKQLPDFEFIRKRDEIEEEFMEKCEKTNSWTNLPMKILDLLTLFGI